MKNLTKSAHREQILNINEAIQAKNARVVDDDGNMLGIMPLEQALELSKSRELDLIEINKETTPPICKIMDYGKYKYLQQKKRHEARKKQKVIILKEFYVHLNIGIHDYNVKLKQIINSLNSDNKVKLAVKLRGREMTYSAKAIELLKKFYDDIGGEQIAKLDISPKMEGNSAVMILSAIPKK